MKLQNLFISNWHIKAYILIKQHKTNFFRFYMGEFMYTPSLTLNKNPTMPPMLPHIILLLHHFIVFMAK